MLNIWGKKLLTVKANGIQIVSSKLNFPFGVKSQFFYGFTKLWLVCDLPNDMGKYIWDKLVGLKFKINWEKYVIN